MNLKRVIPPETEELLYNNSYVPEQNETFFQQIHLEHFVYPTNPPSAIRKLVLVWEAVIKNADKNIDILHFKFECGYLLECDQLTDDSLIRLETLLNQSAALFVNMYSHISLTHTVRCSHIHRFPELIQKHLNKIHVQLYL